jgi:hypothetical protein
VRSLIINNCGVDGLEAVLADAGRVNYTFDVVSLRQRGRLAAIPASTTFSTPSVVRIASIVGDGTGRYTARDITQVVLPSVFTLAAAELVVIGDLVGVTDLTVDNAALLDLRSTGNSVGLLNGVYSFTQLRATRSSELRFTTTTLLSVSGLLEVADTSRMVLTSVSDFRVSVNQFVMSVASTLTFTGRWLMEAVASIVIPTGAVVDGTGGGLGSSVVPSGCTLGAAATVRRCRESRCMWCASSPHLCCAYGCDCREARTAAMGRRRRPDRRVVASSGPRTWALVVWPMLVVAARAAARSR